MNRSHANVVSILGCVAMLGACGPSGEPGPGDPNGAGDTDGGSDSPDASGIIDLPPQPDAGDCGAQQETIQAVIQEDPPDLLIVLDRSGSMSDPVSLFPFGQPSKWSMMKEALEGITQDYDDKIRFGLALFPTQGNCGVSAGAAVNVGLNQSNAIMGSVNGTGPDGFTPAHLGLQEAAAIYGSMPVNSAGRYVVFATDGIPNCGGSPPTTDTASDAETVQAVADLANAGVKTFVLGFGDLFGLDPQLLNDAAVAGQVPKAGGPPYFYHADSASDLEAALDQIAGGIIVPSCTFTLAEDPPDPNLVTVTIDGTPVPRDANHQNGWDYHPDASTVTFFGSYCGQIETGAAAGVSFVYGCPGPIVN